MTAEEINAARRSLTAFRGEFQRFTGWAGNAGRSAAKAFGKNFKSIALFTITELARGALPAIGARIVENWGKTGTKAGKSFGKRAKKAATDEMQSFSSKVAGGSKWNLGALPIVGAAVLAAAAATQLKSAFEAAIEQERITISLDALSLDGGGGSRIFEALRGDALRTGIDVSSQAGIVQKMMAQGIDETGALKLNRAMLDIAGGTGLTTNEVELLGTALSQIKGKGVAAMEELRGQIAEKGVPIFEALRQRFNAETVAEVFQAIAAGKVTADDVLETFSNLEGPFARFIGASDRLGKTGGGLLARLGQEAEDLKRVFAAEVMPELKPALEAGIGLIQRMKDGAAEFGKALANAIGYVQAAFEALSLTEMLQLAGLALKAKLLEALEAARGKVVEIFAAFEDGTFESALERAANTFKRVMLEGALEVVEALSGAVAGKESGPRSALDMLKPGGMFRLAAGLVTSPASQMLLDRLQGMQGQLGGSIEGTRSGARSILSDVLSGSIGGLSDEEKRTMEALLSKITAKRASNLAARTDDDPVVPPGGATGGGGGPSTPYDPTAMIAGGLANAISKITGGGDILMTKQLATQEATLAAAEKTAGDAKRTADAVEKLVTYTHPRRVHGSVSSARLVL